ncbi:VVA0879 family protein [Nitrosovibrio sp. Nv6]|uniref:VVA0879 family protein n=1 Tax=Nitrosovibrio sp. Nv6 TaxID=1855340 RepID=UPI0008B4A834|nr:VVA0879 family protein [Nitrosovibrio sp. Nv6]SEO65218.1 hypothetical protein SAMN05216316_0714 [Nitrosovibrio sp. Nv6]
MSTTPTMTLDEYHSALKAQGVPRDHLAMKCPICKTIQSASDLIAAGAGKNFDEVEKYLGFYCIGRFTRAGGHKKGVPPGRGCDWTLGGFLQAHELEVVTPDGVHNPRFALATPEEAQAHMNAKKGVTA